LKLGDPTKRDGAFLTDATDALAQVELEWRRLLAAFDMPDACKNDSQLASCASKALTPVLGTIESSAKDDDAKKKLLAALARAANGGELPPNQAATLIKKLESLDAESFLRVIDLSEALVTKMVYVTNALDTLAHDLGASVPIAPGVATILLRELAAEVAAALLDAVVDRLERARVVNKAGTSIAACRLYAGGLPYATVTAKVLRRIILRQGGAASGDPSAAVAIETCDALNHVGKDACDEVLKRAGLKKPALTPRWTPKPEDQPQKPPAEVAALEAHVKNRGPNAVREQGEEIQAAAALCPSPKECDIRFVGRAAGIANLTAETRPPSVPSDKPRDPSVVLGVTREQLRAELGQIELLFERSTKDVAELKSKVDVLGETLVKMQHCESRRRTQVEARFNLLDKLTHNDVCYDFPRAGFIAGSSANLRVRFDRAACSDGVFKSFNVDLSGDIFDVCDARVNVDDEETIVVPVANFALALVKDVPRQPTKVLEIHVLGHSDSRLVTTPACINKLVTPGAPRPPDLNQLLSERRARALASAIQNRLGPAAGARVLVDGKGAGAKGNAPCGGRPLATDAKATATYEECNLTNRRIEVRFDVNDSALELWCTR
jgi:hypothetical protein